MSTRQWHIKRAEKRNRHQTGLCAGFICGCFCGRGDCGGFSAGLCDGGCHRPVPVLSDLSRAIDNTQIAGGITPKKIRIDSVNALIIDLVPHLLSAYKDRRPDVQLEFHSGSNLELVDKLKRSELDVLMIYGDHHLEHSHSHTAMKLFDNELSTC
ncbi:LysR substrate-binding domain-containing protein [Vibrio quintilis]|uniref:LysR substrate binding domain protein n=1 Tax=Vibrio quintilis TaxID=1117707 RepID=A0A1M7YWT2_9VIBR|nr:LysR substrate-binding domain-containing protein [Vibrio quintilis]SHO57058.1 LysR substrate binding domain protein [Vibrio quintilis]